MDGALTQHFFTPLSVRIALLTISKGLWTNIVYTPPNQNCVFNTMGGALTEHFFTPISVRIAFGPCGSGITLVHIPLNSNCTLNIMDGALT